MAPTYIAISINSEFSKQQVRLCSKMRCPVLVAWFLASFITVSGDTCFYDKLEEIEARLQKVESHARNIEHYHWKDLNLETDQGQIKEVRFFKKRINSTLKLTWSGNLRQFQSPNVGCCRWFFKINNEECTNPTTIDAPIYKDKPLNLDQHVTIDGMCKVALGGIIPVSFNVGTCPGHGVSNCYTCWNSSCHVIIEEI